MTSLCLCTVRDGGRTSLNPTWKQGHGLRDLRRCQEGEIYFGLKDSKGFWGTGAGAELRKGSVVDRKTESVLQDGVVAWPDLQRKQPSGLRLKTCRDLERVFLGNYGEKTTNTWSSGQMM